MYIATSASRMRASTSALSSRSARCRDLRGAESGALDLDRLTERLQTSSDPCHFTRGSDIGLIAAKVPVGDEDDTVEGYHLFAGGGFGPNADVGQEVYRDLKAEDAPKTVEKLLKAYLSHRTSSEETFLGFARRHDGETLRKLADAEAST